MKQSKIAPERKKKIKTILSMMNKQNQRFFPIVQPLVEMMDLVIADDEIEYLLKLGHKSYSYQGAAKVSNLSDEKFQTFFDKMKRKGLIHVEFDENGREKYSLNAIAVGWYEVMMHYNVGKPQEKEFSEKWNEFFEYFKKFNFFPLRNVQNIIMRNMLKPNQDAALMNPDMEGMTKRKTIPVNTSISPSDTKIYPTFHVDEYINKFGDQEAIYAFPCVCRHGNSLIGSPCTHDMPKESCIAFGDGAKVWAGWGYGRSVTKDQAMDILKEVRDKGAVHSVIHEKDDTSLPVAAICNCCWDCCGILKSYNMGAMSLKYNSSFIASIKDDVNCKGCGNCEKYCPTTAMKLMDEKVSLNSEMCIGCGQCAFQCRQNNIEMVPNEREVYLPMLKKSEARISA